MIRYDCENLTIFSKNTAYKDWDFICKLMTKVIIPNTHIFLISVNSLSLQPDYCLDFREYQLLSEYKTTIEKSGKRLVIIIEALLEAPTYQYNLKSLILSLHHFVKIEFNNIITFSGAQTNLNSPVPHALSFMMFGNHQTIDNVIISKNINKHFISLSRLAKQQRILGTIEILKRGLKDKGLISLGSGYYDNKNENYLLDRYPEYADIFPLTLDGTIIDNTQYKAPQAFLDTLVNIVFETSYDREINKAASWNVPFLTEKTSKPFVWGQIPIFINCQGSVDIIRKLGFDLFDDMIDHSYDNEIDPINRITLAVNQLEKICNISLSKLEQFKLDNMDRFISNQNLMIEFVQNKNYQLTFNNLKNTLNR